MILLIKEAAFHTTTPVHFILPDILVILVILPILVTNVGYRTGQRGVQIRQSYGLIATGESPSFGK
jgi:hypothetical protein